MIFLISLVLVAIFIAACSKPLRKHPVPFYIGAAVIAVAVCICTFAGVRFPTWFNSYIWPLVSRSGLSAALFVAVMYAGALPNGSAPVKKLMPIRGELSILACILTLGHNISYGKTYFLRLTSLQSYTRAAAVCSIVMLCIMLPLFVTSFKSIRKKMPGKAWKKLQRFAYGFYALLYIHVMLLTVPSALKGRAGYTLTIFLYTAVFAAYLLCRILKAVALRKKAAAGLPRRQIAAAVCAVVVALAVTLGLNAAASAAQAAQEQTEVLSAASTEVSASESTETTEEASEAASEEAAEASEAEEEVEAAEESEQPSESEDVTEEAAEAEEAEETEESESEESEEAASEEPEESAEAETSESAEAEEAAVSETAAAESPAASESAAASTTPAASDSPAASASASPSPSASASASAQPSAAQSETPAASAEPSPEPSVEASPEPSYVYQNGTFSGSGEGYYGTISVSVTIQNDVITGISVTSYVDDDDYFGQAKAVINSILAAQSTAVDAVSGATYSSKGIISAVSSALASAKN